MHETANYYIYIVAVFLIFWYHSWWIKDCQISGMA